MMRWTMLLAALLTVAPASAQVLRQNAAPGPYVPYGAPPTPSTFGMPLVSDTDSDSKRITTWGTPPVTGVKDANDDPISGDPICRELRFFELLELSDPGSDQCGVTVADFAPTASTEHWRSQSIVTTDGAQSIGGVKNFEDAPTYDDEPGSHGWTIGPFLITGHTHSTTTTYFPLTGGTAKSQANSQAASPLACPKVRRVNVESLDSAGALRTMPSSNSMTFGFVVSSSDSATAQTVVASTTGATGTPTWTTGWAIDAPVALWIKGTGGDGTMNTAYRIWVSCY